MRDKNSVNSVGSVREDGMSEPLPKGWIQVKFTDILEIRGGSQPPKKTFIYKPKEGYVRLLQIRDFGDKPFPTYVPMSSKLRLVKNDELLLARYGGTSKDDSLGRVCTGMEGAYNVALVKLLFSKEYIPAGFIKYLLGAHFFIEVISKNSRSCQTGFNKNDLEDVAFPLPPLNEQKRIVAKLDAIIPRIDSLKARLDKVPTLIKRFRQSVLTAAVTGKLTEKWRAAHPDVESAKVLLERIRKYRIKNAANGRELNAIKKHYIEGDLRVQVKNNVYDLPATWHFCEISTIGNVYNGSTPSRKINKYWRGNIHWVSSGEVSNTRISDTRERITKSGFENSSVKLFPIGTVLIAMIGEGKTRGQAAILDIESTCNQNVAAVVINHGLVLPEYLYNWFFMQYERNRSFGSGSGPKALNCQRVRELDFVLPPLEEQKEIVRQVDKLFALADKLETHYQNAKARIDKLSQSVLAKAFRGELVPQNPNDEPAEKLLERIMEEKARLSRSTQRPRRKKN